MKRIVLWVDTKNRKVAQTLVNLKKLLDSSGLKYSVVDVVEIAERGSDQ